MGGGYFSNAGVFLIDAVFGLYIFAVLLRFLFQLVRADFYNPLCQAIVTVTNPALRPLRRYIPAFRGIDSASVVLLLALQLTNTLLVLVVLGIGPRPAGLVVIAVAELASKTVWIFLGAVVIQVVLSWVSPGGHNPVSSIVHALTDPVSRPARRLIPTVGGLDFSPVVVIIALQLVLMLGVAPLEDLGRALLL
jgi:YggT family protein